MAKVLCFLSAGNLLRGLWLQPQREGPCHRLASMETDSKGAVREVD